jgi:hypothetical protein
VRQPADQPIVSVIIPVYNGARWLSTAVASVLSQTLSNLELLIVDDASTDDTAGIAEQWTRRDPRVRLLRQPTNRGQSAARNLALGLARGEWIAPVDADDEIRPDRLRLLVEAGEREQADLIADGILFEGDRPPGTPTELMPWGGHAQRMERLTAEQLIKSGTKGGWRSLGYLKPLMRRRFLDERRLRYSEDLRFAEDFNLYARALFCGARFVLFPESHYVYWQTPASASRTETPHIARHALSSSRRLRAAVPQAGSAELAAALDEYEQRWSLLIWSEQVKRGLANRHFRRVVELLVKRPASVRRILRFVRDRANLKRQTVVSAACQPRRDSSMQP